MRHIPTTRAASTPHAAAALALACAIFIIPSKLQAQEGDEAKTERATNLYTAAVKLYNEGRNRESIAKFDEVIALDPQPVYHCSRAAVLLKVAELDRAIEDLEICRDKYASTPEERAHIDAQLQAVSIVDNALLSRSRSVAVEIANPTEAKVTDKVIIDPSKGNDGNGNPIDTPSTTSPGPLRPIGFTALALGSSLMMSALVLDVASTDLRTRFEQEADGGAGTTQEEYDNLLAQMERRQQAYMAMMGSGVVLGAVGITTLIIARRKSSQKAPQSTLWLSPQSKSGATLQMRLSF